MFEARSRSLFAFPQNESHLSFMLEPDQLENELNSAIVQYLSSPSIETISYLSTTYQESLEEIVSHLDEAVIKSIQVLSSSKVTATSDPGLKCFVAHILHFFSVIFLKGKSCYTDLVHNNHFPNYIISILQEGFIPDVRLISIIFEKLISYYPADFHEILSAVGLQRIISFLKLSKNRDASTLSAAGGLFSTIIKILREGNTSHDIIAKMAISLEDVMPAYSLYALQSINLLEISAELAQQKVKFAFQQITESDNIPILSSSLMIIGRYASTITRQILLLCRHNNPKISINAAWCIRKVVQRNWRNPELFCYEPKDTLICYLGDLLQEQSIPAISKINAGYSFLCLAMNTCINSEKIMIFQKYYNSFSTLFHFGETDLINYTLVYFASLPTEVQEYAAQILDDDEIIQELEQVTEFSSIALSVYNSIK